MGSVSNQTKIVAVGGSGRSIRTVIPLWVAELIGLEEGDSISWHLVAIKTKNMRIEIRKVE